MQTGTVWPGGRLKPWGMGVLVFGLVLACYWPAVQGALVFDDAAHVTRPALRSWSGLGRIWVEAGATAQYYPLLNTAFWVEHRLWGDAVAGESVRSLTLTAADSASQFISASVKDVSMIANQPGPVQAVFPLDMHNLQE